MAATAILDFQKFEILTVFHVQGANLRHRAKCHQNRLDSSGEIWSDLVLVCEVSGVVQ